MSNKYQRGCNPSRRFWQCFTWARRLLHESAGLLKRWHRLAWNGNNKKKQTFSSRAGRTCGGCRDGGVNKRRKESGGGVTAGEKDEKRCHDAGDGHVGCRRLWLPRDGWAEKKEVLAFFFFPPCATLLPYFCSFIQSLPWCALCKHFLLRKWNWNFYHFPNKT